MSPPRILVWLVEGTAEGCIEALRPHLPDGADVSLLHVVPADLAELGGGALTGLLGRGRDEAAMEERLEVTLRGAAEELLADAAARLGRPAATVLRRGRVEREVVAAAAQGVDLLVVARGGDLGRLGPPSLGREVRFVVDHAPCAVLLLWPAPPPGLDSMPPPPGHRPPGRGHRRGNA